MKKIKINRLDEFKGSSLNREQLKKIVGGTNSGGNNPRPCDGKREGDTCMYNGRWGVCKYMPFSYGQLVCWVG